LDAPAPPVIYTLSLHDALPIYGVTYSVGGTWQPLNAVPEYLAWPGSPFTGKLATGSFNHDGIQGFVLYAVQLLIGKKGFLLHNRSEEHTSELQSRFDLVCRLLL